MHSLARQRSAQRWRWLLEAFPKCFCHQHARALPATPEMRQLRDSCPTARDSCAHVQESPPSLSLVKAKCVLSGPICWETFALKSAALSHLRMELCSHLQRKLRFKVICYLKRLFTRQAGKLCLFTPSLDQVS